MRPSLARRFTLRFPDYSEFARSALGQYLAAGQAIVSLQSLSPIYVNFGVPQQETPKVIPGHVLRVTNGDLPGMAFTGRITALDSVINEQTRNIQVQATVTNKENKLRPGMFVQVELPLGQPRQVVPLPASAINYAPYGDSVFVVTEMKDAEGEYLSRRPPASREGRGLSRRSSRDHLGNSIPEMKLSAPEYSVCETARRFR